MSVLMAMNSTPATSASIMRLIALQPPPPTPTTRITARYGWSEWGRRASRESSPTSTSWGRLGSAAGSRRRFGGASGAASPAAAASSLSPVALNSWASGPSRMLCRFAIGEHLPREVTVRLGRPTGRIVLQHRGSLHRGLGVPDGLADIGVEHEVAEVLLQDLDRLARMQR